MIYTKYAPLGLRTGHGTFETLYCLKYKSLEESEAAYDYVICDFVKDENDIIFIECYHVRYPEIKKYYRLMYQNFVPEWGIDTRDDEGACEFGTSLFL